MLPPLYTVPPTAALCIRAYTHTSLTPPAIIAAASTAFVHALPDDPTPFISLFVFYGLGTSATKYKASIKSSLTVEDSEIILKEEQEEGKTAFYGKEKKKARGVYQVLANSWISSVLLLAGYFSENADIQRACLVGSVSAFAAATADTLSSEIGILSPSKPRLIYAPWRVCLPGENGGVSLLGLAAGVAGAGIIGYIAREGRLAVFGLGVAGTLLDSVLGALFQGSVVRDGKVVENVEGGKLAVAGAKGEGLGIGGWSNNLVNAVTTGLIGVAGFFAAGGTISL